MKLCKWFYLSGGHITTEVGPHWAAHVVADVNTDHADHEQRARLIAAAPDLLTALQDMLDAFGNQRFKVRQDFSKMVRVEAARAAIARAKGAQS